MKKIGALLIVAAVAAFFLADLARATPKLATEAADVYESPSAIRYSYVTPTLGIVGADTAKISVLLKDVPYFDLADGPAWRLVLGVRSTKSGADTVRVEMWHGVTSSSPLLYRSCELDSVAVVSGSPHVFDIASCPLSVLPQLTVYVTDDDSTAAAFYVDLFLLKGR